MRVQNVKGFIQNENVVYLQKYTFFFSFFLSPYKDPNIARVVAELSYTK